MATSVQGGRDVHEADDFQLSDALGDALRNVVVARDRLQAESPQTPAYQGALAAYLQAAVHHLAILAVAQAQQTEQLSAEVAALRAQVEASGPVVH
ncbi:MAG: hypothetical protein JO339_17855 [Alphaproteobacteria bacterium]|nr:hypothetical protein [Alphaproteobacteria bacterium]